MGGSLDFKEGDPMMTHPLAGVGISGVARSIVMFLVRLVSDNEVPGAGTRKITEAAMKEISPPGRPILGGAEITEPRLATVSMLSQEPLCNAIDGHIPYSGPSMQRDMRRLLTGSVNEVQTRCKEICRHMYFDALAAFNSFQKYEQLMLDSESAFLMLERCINDGKPADKDREDGDKDEEEVDESSGR